MTLTVEALSADRMSHLGRLFRTDETANRCWCMWFIVPVKRFHEAGAAGNCARFQELAEASEHPLGLIAYRKNEPVGWVAVGPRSRYIRALKTPTYRGGVAQDDSTWLVPCFFVREEDRGAGLTETLLMEAISFAAERGATSIEGFPFSMGRRRSSGDLQVGFQSVFERCGFKLDRAPSANRVVMRLELRESHP